MIGFIINIMKEGMRMNQDNILVVEDEIEIAKAIEIYLKSQGYNVYIANNGKAGLEMVERYDIHLAIVDIMMPVMDGIEMTMKIRENYDFPIIFLSAKSEDIDKITGLNIGGDDYVTKPFVPMELLARVSSQLRRYHKYLNMIGKIQEDQAANKYVVGGLELDLDTKEVSVDGKAVKVTPIELKILELLMEKPGRVFQANKFMKMFGMKLQSTQKQSWFMCEICEKKSKLTLVIPNI